MKLMFTALLLRFLFLSRTTFYFTTSRRHLGTTSKDLGEMLSKLITESALVVLH